MAGSFCDHAVDLLVVLMALLARFHVLFMSAARELLEELLESAALVVLSLPLLLDWPGLPLV
ncbi:hypothetical protein [Mycoplana dimorpha]|uniref:hypothetical protein n=1 Tax=Mycoplana dimorpha TaxID=28320 RepID=UPI00147501A9